MFTLRFVLQSITAEGHCSETAQELKQTIGEVAIFTAISTMLDMNNALDKSHTCQHQSETQQTAGLILQTMRKQLTKQ